MTTTEEDIEAIKAKCLPPYQIKYGKECVEDKSCQLRLDEILHYLRGEIESSHRIMIWREQVFLSTVYLRLNANQPDTLPSMSYPCAKSCWNKTVPVYVLEHREDTPRSSSWLPRSNYILFRLHNYLYRTWFRPYRTDIDHEQFLARVFDVVGPIDTTSTDEVADATRRMTVAIVNRLDEVRAKVQSAARHLPDEGKVMNELRAMDLSIYTEYAAFMKRQRYLQTRPLFRAMSISISRRDTKSCDAVSNIDKLPVIVSLTGCTYGLSTPITFDDIKDETLTISPDGQAAQMTLETAVKFVMSLEAREERAFGPQPNPHEADYVFCPDIQEAAERAGIRRHAAQLVGPSSSWVDTEQYPQWTGRGRLTDSVHMVVTEESSYRRERQRTAGELDIRVGFGERVSQDEMTRRLA